MRKNSIKNITLAGKFCFMGMKIDFHAHEFRFRPTHILKKQTISKKNTTSRLGCPPPVACYYGKRAIKCLKSYIA